MKQSYKAVRLDRTSHFDGTTKWRKGAIVRVAEPDEGAIGPCGRGIHCSPTLLDAVSWQRGPSRYCVVEPLDIIASGATKARCSGVRVLRWLLADEQDELAGFKLFEANHAANPLLGRRKRLLLDKLTKQWASVRASVWASVGDSVGESFWASVRDSVGAYIGGLFPGIAEWRYVKSLGPDPWRPLLTLWYGGYVPSFDGKVWRLHAGPKAEIVYTSG